jgi:hypothetical protein
MKLYFGVTTFRSSGYLPRKSYITSHHIWVDISPRFDLSFSWMSLLFLQSKEVSVELSLLRRHRLSINGQNFLQAKKLIAAMPAKTRRLWTSYVTFVDRLCYPHPHGINLFISKLLQNVKSCVTPTPIGYYLFIFRHNSKKYRSRISFLCCKLLQIWMKHWLFCTYNRWPEFNDIQMVKPRRNHSRIYVNRIERRSVKCELNL